MSATYRIVQWGTGSVGKHALRAIVERPDYELAGLRVYSPHKVGRDAGEILGVDHLGIIATDAVEDIVALDADCVCYTALGGTVDASETALDDICALLASGKNVVSSAVEQHAYLRPDHQHPRAGTDALRRMTEACEKGSSSFLHVGVNPGFAMDIWPMHLSRLSRRIDHMQLVEVVDMREYASEHMVRDAIGFGQRPDEETALDMAMKDIERSSFSISMKLLSEAFGIELDKIEYERESAITPVPIEVKVGTIEAGTVAAIRFAYIGYFHGRPSITLEWIWRVTDDVAPQWPSGVARWITHIDGDPTLHSEITLATELDSTRGVSLAVATLVTNSVPTVCAAAPGILDNVHLPVHTGGFFSR
jgi:hypothetical protein